jgi:PAS domain S-box-containing protein
MKEEKNGAESVLQENEALKKQVAELQKMIRMGRSRQAQSHLAEFIIDSSLDGILAVDMECRYTIWNRGMERISGMKREAVLGRVASEVFPFLKEIGEDEYLADALQGKATASKDRPYYIQVSGKKGFFEGRYLPLRSETGEVIGGIGIIRDVTDRKKDKGELLESEEKFRAVCASAKDAIILIDSAGKIVLWNEAAEHIFGYKAAQAVGKDCHELLAPSRYMGVYKKGFSRFQKTGKGPVVGETRELEALRRDGSEFLIELSVSAVRIQQRWHAIGVIRDITVRRETEDELRKKMHDLEIFQAAAVDREMKMVQLKRRIKELEAQLKG